MNRAATMVVMEIHKQQTRSIRIFGWMKPLLLASKASRRGLRSSLMGDEVLHRDGVASALKRSTDLKEMMDRLGRGEFDGDRAAYARLLWACSDAKALADGIRVHDHIVSSGLQCDMFLATCLISMYGKCRRVVDARRIFDGMPRRNVFSWTSLIAAYAQNGHRREALELFKNMELVPNSITFVTVLGACCSLTFLTEGRRLHAMVTQRGFNKDLNVQNALLNMYAKCGSLEDAERIFGQMQERNLISWNSMVTAYVQHGHCNKALHLFQEMLYEGVILNSITFLTILNACTSSAALAIGKWIHACIAETGYVLDIAVGSALVNMYAKCESFQDAMSTFNKLQQRNVVTWTAMITACAQYGECKQALELFQRMQLEGVMPNEITFATTINASGTLLALKQGTNIHRLVVESGYKSDLAVQNGLIDMYGKCGNLAEASRIFESMRVCDEVTWTTMVTLCAQHGQEKQALFLFKCMQQEGFKADKTCYAAVVNACSSKGTLAEGRRTHAQIIDTGFSSNLMVCNALVDMYSNCGCPEQAVAVFHRMPERDVVTWNALIAAFSQHRHGKHVPKLFCQMQQDGTKPDDITFVTLLSACSHAGLVREGCDYFVSIGRDHGVIPSSENYGCMVDLLGRAGHLAEAENFIWRIPPEADTIVPWMTLLSACRVHSDMDRAKRAAENVAKLDPCNPSPHVVLSNIYAESHIPSADKLIQAASLQGLGWS